MLKLNLFQLFKNYSRKKEEAEVIVREWIVLHDYWYKDFCTKIENIRYDNISILMDMFRLMKECMPPESDPFYSLLRNMFTNPKSFVKSLQSPTEWAGIYAEEVAKCIANKKLWLGINLKTGEIKTYTSKQRGLLMIQSGSPMEVWEKLPLTVKAELRGIVEVIVKNGKGRGKINKEELQESYLAIPYFVNLFFLIQMTFVPGFMANLYDKVIGEEKSLAYCIYYFVVYDHGLPKMVRILNDIMAKEDIDGETLALVQTALPMFIRESLDLKLETRETWKNSAERCNPEIWKEIMYAIKHSKVKKGKERCFRTLEELVKEGFDTEKILRFLDENPGNGCLAYLLRALVDAKVVNEQTPYMTFHRAIESFTGHKQEYAYPQRQYGELKELELIVTPKGERLKRAKEIIDKWREIFSE